MRILILGGIAESKQLAQQLIDHNHFVIYSIAGLLRKPQLACDIHIGGFSTYDKNGSQGLADYCRVHDIELLIDATHPYAVEISSNAVSAARLNGITCWRYCRPGWNASKHAHWRRYHEWTDLAPQLVNYKRPFFTVGASILKHVKHRPKQQQWVIRCARKLAEVEGVIQINAIGPFYYNDELALMRQYKVDALISKDSGCSRVADKLDAAHTLNIPVYVQHRPPLANADLSFDRTEDLVARLDS